MRICKFNDKTGMKLSEIDKDKYYTPGEVAYFLDCSISTVSRLCKKVLSHNTAVGVRIKGETLINYIKSKEVKRVF